MSTTPRNVKVTKQTAYLDLFLAVFVSSSSQVPVQRNSLFVFCETKILSSISKFREFDQAPDKTMSGTGSPKSIKSKQINPVKPGGVNIIGHPDKETNRERKASLLSGDYDDEEAKEFVFDHPLTLTDFYITEVILLIAGLILFVIIMVWVSTRDIKWSNANYGSSNYEGLYD